MTSICQHRTCRVKERRSFSRIKTEIVCSEPSFTFLCRGDRVEDGPSWPRSHLPPPSRPSGVPGPLTLNWPRTDLCQWLSAIPEKPVPIIPFQWIHIEPVLYIYNWCTAKQRQRFVRYLVCWDYSNQIAWDYLFIFKAQCSFSAFYQWCALYTIVFITTCQLLYKKKFITTVQLLYTISSFIYLSTTLLKKYSYNYLSTTLRQK